jgi:hypothetical protein
MIFSRLSLVTFLGLAAASLASNIEPALEARTLHLGLGGGLDIGAGVGIGGGAGIGSGVEIGAGNHVSHGHGSSSSKGKHCGCESKSSSKKGKGDKSTSTKKQSHHSSKHVKTHAKKGHSTGHKSSGSKGHSSTSAKAQAHVVATLKTCHKDIVRLGSELKGCLEGVNHKQAHLVVKAVAGVLGVRLPALVYTTALTRSRCIAGHARVSEGRRFGLRQGCGRLQGGL